MYCFLVATVFTSTLFIGFSIDLQNIALLLNLAFRFLILLPSFYGSLRNSVFYIQYMVLKMDFALILIFYEFFFNCNPEFK